MSLAPSHPSEIKVAKVTVVSIPLAVLVGFCEECVYRGFFPLLLAAKTRLPLVAIVGLSAVFCGVRRIISTKFLRIAFWSTDPVAVGEASTRQPCRGGLAPPFTAGQVHLSAHLHWKTRGIKFRAQAHCICSVSLASSGCRVLLLARDVHGHSPKRNRRATPGRWAAASTLRC